MDPISSLNQNSSNSCIDDDGGSSAPVAAPVLTLASESSRVSSESGSSAESSPGTTALVQQFSSSTSLKSAPPATSPPAPRSTGFLVTSSGPVPGGSYRVAASLSKDEVHGGPLDGTRAEVGTVSVQFGKQDDVQLVGARETLALHHGGYGFSLTGEAGLVRANLGRNNDDGSVGGNIGSGAELFGGEATIDTPAGSVTGGLSVAMSLSGSVGVRDADHDGEPEYCAKISVPAFTIGACIERFW